MKGIGGLDTFSSINKYFRAFLDKVLSSFFVLKYWVLPPTPFGELLMFGTDESQYTFRRICPCVIVIGGLGYIATWQSPWAFAMF